MKRLKGELPELKALLAKCEKKKKFLQRKITRLKSAIRYRQATKVLKTFTPSVASTRKTVDLSLFCDDHHHVE